MNIGEVADEGGLRQESRPLSDVHIPPPQDEGSESAEEGESEEGEFGDASGHFEAFEVIDMVYEDENDEEYLEKSCPRLIVTLGRSMTPTAQMMTTARSMIPMFLALKFSDVDSESVSDYSTRMRTIAGQSSTSDKIQGPFWIKSNI